MATTGQRFHEPQSIARSLDTNAAARLHSAPSPTERHITMGKLDGRTALITGGARGQGRSHALTLAQEGANVVMIDNLEVKVPHQDYPGGSAEQYAETQQMLTDLGAKFVARVGDVRNFSDLQGAVAEAITQFGSV